jgi:hypothetical protein
MLSFHGVLKGERLPASLSRCPSQISAPRGVGVCPWRCLKIEENAEKFEGRDG